MKPPIIVGGKGGEQQDCVLACYAVAYQPLPGVALSLHAAWSLEVSDHACGRLLQRAPHADLRSAALEAALAFAAADAMVVEPIIGSNTTIYLPAGPGAFVGTIIGGKTVAGREYIYARCRAYLSAAFLRPDQIPLSHATRADPTLEMDGRSPDLKGAGPLRYRGGVVDEPGLRSSATAQESLAQPWRPRWFTSRIGSAAGAAADDLRRSS